ncbi:hypothetical protein CAEBREN_11543 [Caenorhabditis brenneri]|uniref:Uncharacterized protein n=1 Tax=Caenorhabditis brenneri TaxID=135651 RepID=G0MIX2_CAEBE|nr:hypothetical protein CAEBREN_11543 [Caenorhabditis brenneri]
MSKSNKRFLFFSPRESKKTKDSESPNESFTITDSSSTHGISSEIPPLESLIPLEVQSIILPKSISCEEFVKTLLSMATVIQKLQVQNAELVHEIGGLNKAVCELKDQLKLQNGSSPNKKSFAEMVSKGLSAPAAQVSLLRAAELAQSSESRKSSVILRNVDLSSDTAQDNEFGSKVAKECNVTGSCSVFRIPLRNDALPLIKLQLQSKEDAVKILSSFETMKKKFNGCQNATARPDYSKPELEKHRMAWKEVIRRNNEAKKRLYTVRNLEVTKIAYKDGQAPYPWVIRQGK